MMTPALAAEVTVVTRNNGVEQTIYLTKDMMCTVSKDGIMMFDANAQLVRMADPESQTKQEMTKEQMAQLGAMAKQGMDSYTDAMGKNSDMMEQVRKQALQSIQHLEGKEREMAEAQINKQFGMAGGMSMEAKTYEPMNKKQKINGYNTSGYAIMQGDTKMGELWTAPLSEFGLSDDDLAVIGKFREFMQSGMEGSPFADEIMAEFEMFDPNSDKFIGFLVSKTESDGFEEERTTKCSPWAWAVSTNCREHRARSPVEFS
jgi:hypothetical protein